MGEDGTPKGREIPESELLESEDDRAQLVEEDAPVAAPRTSRASEPKEREKKEDLEESQTTPRREYRYLPIEDGESIEAWSQRELIKRAEYSGSKLKGEIVGTVRLAIDKNPKQLIFEWSGDLPTVSLGDKGDEAGCVISISEKNFRRVAAGVLNPQIAMLSDKIKVEGNFGAAVYFFNLVAP